MTMRPVDSGPTRRTDRRRAAPPIGSALADRALHSLFEAGVHLQAALPGAHGESEQHLHAAVAELDQLIRQIRDAAFAATLPTDMGGELHPGAHALQASTAAGPVPRNARAELHRLLDTADVLKARLHRVTVALALSQEAAADLLDRLVDDAVPRREQRRANAEHARGVAGACRDFVQRLEHLDLTGCARHERLER